MHILTVCGMGFGTSLMLLMTAQEIGRKHGIEIKGEATDLGTYRGKPCDLIMASADIAKQVNSDKPVISVNNLLDKAGIEKSLLPYLK